MPCYQTRVTQVDMSQADIDIVRAAVEGLGFVTRETGYGLSIHRSVGGEVGQFRKGIGMTFFNDALSEEHFRKAYAESAVKGAARKFGWNVTAKSGSKFTLERRAF